MGVRVGTMVTLNGTAFKQNDQAPWEFSFVEDVKKIAPFCGVPRKKEGHEGGFQRSEDPARVDRLSEFFSNDENSSPTSIVLGFHKEQAELTFTTGEDGDKIRQAQLEIEWPEEEEPIEELATRLLEGLQARIEVEEDDEAEVEVEGDEEAEVEVEGDEEAEVEEDEEAEVEEDEEAEEDEELDFGVSVIDELIDLLSDENWVEDENNHDFIRHLGKPALVIDGQHRLLGADEVVGDIPFSFVALVDASWAEMVFQFCVINHTAVPVKSDVITTNAALSLTKQELESLGERLAAAGFQDTKLDIMNRCYLSEGAPFENRVKMTHLSPQQNAGRMGKAGIDKLAKPWRKGSGTFLTEMKKQVYDGEGLTAKQRTDRWIQSGDWARAFNLFWRIFSEKFETYRAGGPEPKGNEGDPFWGSLGANINKTGCLEAFQQEWIIYINGKFSDYKGDGINMFEPPLSGADDTPWDVLEKNAKKAVERAALRNMLENDWQLTVLTHGNAKGLMRNQFNKTFANQPLTWTQRDEFHPA